MAQLIGAAGTLVARRRGISVLGDRPPMVSVTNADPETHRAAARRVRAGRSHGAASGAVHPQRPAFGRHHRHPEQLSRFELYCRQISEKEEADRKNKLRGGDVFAPVFDPVQVEVGFHTPRLADGIDIVGGWAEKVGLDVALARELTEAILVRSGRLGRRDHPGPRGRSALDSRPGSRRHPDPADRAGDPRPRCGHRARGDPWRSAQPVYRRRRPRGGPGLVELRPDGGPPARRQGQAVDEVHPADRDDRRSCWRA